MGRIPARVREGGRVSEHKQIHQRMAEAMADIKAIGKDRVNPQQRYNFRGIDDAYNALQPILAQHGVFPVPTVLSFEREARQTKNGGTLLSTLALVRYTFYAPDGSSVEAVTLGEGMDSGDKSANKAMAAAQKYALLQVFMVPTEEPKDSENDSPELAGSSQQPAYQQRSGGNCTCNAPEGKNHLGQCPARGA